MEILIAIIYLGLVIYFSSAILKIVKIKNELIKAQDDTIKMQEDTICALRKRVENMENF